MRSSRYRDRYKKRRHDKYSRRKRKRSSGVRASSLLFWVIMSVVLYNAYVGFKESKDDASSAAKSSASFTANQNWGQDGGDDIVLAPNMLAKNYYIILDTSGSMSKYECSDSGSKMQTAKSSLISWVEQISADSNIALLTFSDKSVEEVLPLRQNSKAYQDEFVRKVLMERPEGGTPLGQSLKQAHDVLGAQAKRQLGYGEYHIVVVTDGVASDPRLMKNTVKRIFKTPILLHTIGFCIDGDHALNQPERARYVSAMNQDELTSRLRGVLAESPRFDITGFEN